MTPLSDTFLPLASAFSFWSACKYWISIFDRDRITLVKASNFYLVYALEAMEDESCYRVAGSLKPFNARLFALEV